MASAVTRTSFSGSGASSGLKWLISFAFPALATLSWAATIPGTWVTAASRCTFLFPPALAPLRSFPSTATARRAGTWPGSPVTAGSSHGCCGCGRNQPSSVSSRKLSAAGGFRLLFFRFSSCPRCCPARCAAYAAGIAGSSAIAARHADSAASNSSASSSFPSLSSIDADGAPSAARSADFSSSRARPAPPGPSPLLPARPPAARNMRQPRPRPALIPATAADAASPAPSAHRSAAPPGPRGTTPGQVPPPRAGGG